MGYKSICTDTPTTLHYKLSTHHTITLQLWFMITQYCHIRSIPLRFKNHPMKLDIPKYILCRKEFMSFHSVLSFTKSPSPSQLSVSLCHEKKACARELHVAHGCKEDLLSIMITLQSPHLTNIHTHTHIVQSRRKVKPKMLF